MLTSQLSVHTQHTQHTYDWDSKPLGVGYGHLLQGDWGAEEGESQREQWWVDISQDSSEALYISALGGPQVRLLYSVFLFKPARAAATWYCSPVHCGLEVTNCVSGHLRRCENARHSRKKLFSHSVLIHCASTMGQVLCYCAVLRIRCSPKNSLFSESFSDQAWSPNKYWIKGSKIEESVGRLPRAGYVGAFFSPAHALGGISLLLINVQSMAPS